MSKANDHFLQAANLMEGLIPFIYKGHQGAEYPELLQVQLHRLG
jgi:hypothetical protein